MTERSAAETLRSPDQEVSVLRIVSFIIRWRTWILSLALLGGTIGLLWGLVTPAIYTSSAMFLPQGSESSTSGLAATASRFGFALPTTSTTWGPAVYVEILKSRGVLEPMLYDTITVVEQRNRRIRVIDMFSDTADSHSGRIDRSVRSLARLIIVSEAKRVGGVTVQVGSELPSVSFALANRLLIAANRFNLTTRRSQAAAERQFVEQRAVEAEETLRQREDRLKAFLESNRALGTSPELSFQRERLQRAVTLQEHVYTSLLQNVEEARIREVRDTPVIAVLQAPQLPTRPDPRKRAQKVILGILAGGMLGIVLAALANWLSFSRRQPSPEAREFFELIQQARPRFMKRMGR